MRISTLAPLLIAVAVAACSAGQDFARPAPEWLAFGETTYQDVVRKFGTPYEEEWATVNEQPVKAVIYFHSVGKIAGAAHYEGVTPEKTMTYFFWEDRLVGYRFASSFKEDHTDFDETKISMIRRGETTHAQVIALLGPPHGVHVYPLVKDQHGTGLVYAYSHGRYVSAGLGTFTSSIYRKILTISLDHNDIVAEINYVTSGTK